MITSIQVEIKVVLLVLLILFPSFIKFQSIQFVSIPGSWSSWEFETGGSSFLSPKILPKMYLLPTELPNLLYLSALKAFKMSWGGYKPKNKCRTFLLVFLLKIPQDCKEFGVVPQHFLQIWDSVNLLSKLMSLKFLSL